METQLIIYTADTYKSKVFIKKTLTWSDFIKKLSQPFVSLVTNAEYANLTSEAKAREKDKGCYIPAETLAEGSRKSSNVGNRTLLVYDLDNSLPLEELKSIYDKSKYELIVHSTRSHTVEAPRHRLIIPVSEPIKPAHYKAVAQFIATQLHPLDFYDASCFDLARVMHFPSVNSDGVYEIYHKKGDLVNIKELLTTLRLDLDDYTKRASKLDDPTKKKGLVGDFCRAFNIHTCIKKFLNDIYIEGEIKGRYTFVGASGANGAVVYDEDRYLYSNHATDPACGKVLNSFDLVRIHKYGALDANIKESPDSTPSFRAMLQFAKEVLAANVITTKPDWFLLLEKNSKGDFKPTVKNIKSIFLNDPVLKDLYQTNEFDGEVYRTRNAPWSITDKRIRITDLDDQGLRNYFAETYGIVNKGALEDVFCELASRCTFNPIKDLIEAESWDGVPRIDTLLIDLFGIEDNAYHRAVSRILFIGLISRVYSPGCKFDTMVILAGAQGRGKSTFIRKLASEKYFNDSFYFDSGKAGMEQLRGFWVIEVPELANLRKKEDAEYKAFLSKTEDTYRPAFAKRTICLPRQCIFVGSTNEDFFLRDVTGNRRFLPVNIGNARGTPKEAAQEWADFEKSIPQLYAEALFAYKNGALNYLADESIAEPYRAKHTECDERSGQVQSFLERPVPKDWYLKVPQSGLADNILSPEELIASGYIPRPFVSAIEIWVECFNKPKEDATRANLKPIHAILKSYKNWVVRNKVTRFKEYGVQKIYERID